MIYGTICSKKNTTKSPLVSCIFLWCTARAIVDVSPFDKIRNINIKHQINQPAVSTMFLRGIYSRRRRVSTETETEPSSSRTTERRSSNQSVGSRNSNQSTSSTFRISIPPNVKCGEEFRVYAGGRVCCVRCPPDAKPGASLQITVPLSEDTQHMSPELSRTRTTSFDSVTSH